MKARESATPVAAAVAAVATLACCLPLGFVGAAGLAAFSTWAGRWRPWLVGASVLLLIFGFVQMYGRKSCARRSRASLAILWAACAVVVLVFLFPQWVATWFA